MINSEFPERERQREQFLTKFDLAMDNTVGTVIIKTAAGAQNKSRTPVVGFLIGNR